MPAFEGEIFLLTNGSVSAKMHANAVMGRKTGRSRSESRWLLRTGAENPVDNWPLSSPPEPLQ